MTREEIRERWETVKRIGCVAFRTHTQPWRSVHYDVADEVGLLMINEGAVWNDESVYRINDPVFWENYASHLKAMIDRDKNRPSVIMWNCGASTWPSKKWQSRRKLSPMSFCVISPLGAK